MQVKRSQLGRFWHTRTSKRQVFSSTVHKKPKGGRTGALQKESLGFFNIHSVAKYQKNGGPFGDIKIFSKKLSAQKF